MKLGLSSTRFFVPDLGSPALRVGLAFALALAIPWAYQYSAAWAGTASYFVLAFIAVIASAWLGRLASGLITLVAGALLSIYFFPSANPGWEVDPQRARLMVLFLVGGFLICLLIEALYVGHSVAMRIREGSDALARQLAAERERMHAFLANLPGVVWEASLTRQALRPTMTFMTPNFEGRLGWTAAALEQVPAVWNAVLHADDEHLLYEALQGARPGSVGSLRNRWVDPDGGVRWFDTHFSGDPQTPSSGRVRCVSLDVTEAERAERALENSELRFRAAAERAPMMIWRADAQGNTTWANRAWLEFRGRPLEFEQGLGWLRDVHPDDLDSVARALTQGSGQREEVRLEFRIRRHDGAQPWIFWLRVPQLSADGALEGYLGFGIDVSQRKELDMERERLLAETEIARHQAELVTQSKDEFLAKISHELRNPLNGILGWTQLLRRESAEPGEVSRGLGLIEASARSLTQLVDDLLDVSRIIAGKMELAMEPTDLRAVLEAACATATPAAQSKGVELECAFAPELLPVRGDSRRLQQIAWNLFANGVKFTPKGGHVKAMLSQEGSYVVLTVADTGIGIAPEFLPEVFSPFRQGEATTTRRYQGLGLGLAIVRQLVELHGGTVSATSEGLGRGATFTVRLPVAIVAAPAALNEPRPIDEVVKGNGDPRIAGAQVLVLDDDATAREVLHLLLSRSGASCRAASSPSEALALLSERLADVIVSDIEMPDEDGYSFIRRVRALDEGHGGTIPAIALTAFARPEDRRRTAAAGFQSHLAKPVDVELLVRTIARLMGPASGAAGPS